MTPYYEQDGITIYHGDCRDVLPSLGHFDAIVTDPPYGQTSLDWDRWPDGWLQAVRESSDSMWCFGTLRMFMERADEFSAAGWRLSQDVIWEKHNGSGFHADRFKRVHEQPSHFYQGEWSDVYKAPVRGHQSDHKQVIRQRQPKHMGASKPSKYETVRGDFCLQRSVIKVRSCHGYAENETQKPVAILEPLLAYSVPPRGIVLDVFGGAGSTAVAAKLRGLSAVVIEVREQQCEIAAKRLAQGALPMEFTA